MYTCTHIYACTSLASPPTPHPLLGIQQSVCNCTLACTMYCHRLNHIAHTLFSLLPPTPFPYLGLSLRIVYMYDMSSRGKV
mmetsp:Transcript_20579/g.52897  ORF Transcript_20579/g.52897 Transcript_20579/m.52897 type:complete len:81 (+) Transcript_20579:969-1211(+)